MAAQAGLSLPWSETLKTGFLVTRLIWFVILDPHAMAVCLKLPPVRILRVNSEGSEASQMHRIFWVVTIQLHVGSTLFTWAGGERGGSVVECWTPEREVGGSKPTAAVLCPWTRHFPPRNYWLITQEVVAPSRATEKLLTGTLSLNTNKQKHGLAQLHTRLWL